MVIGALLGHQLSSVSQQIAPTMSIGRLVMINRSVVAG